MRWKLKIGAHLQSSIVAAYVQERNYNYDRIHLYTRPLPKFYVPNFALRMRQNIYPWGTLIPDRNGNVNKYAPRH